MLYTLPQQDGKNISCSKMIEATEHLFGEIEKV